MSQVFIGPPHLHDFHNRFKQLILQHSKRVLGFFKVFGVFSQVFMFCMQMNATTFVQMSEEILHWICIGWHIDFQRYILDVFYQLDF